MSFFLLYRLLPLQRDRFRLAFGIGRSANLEQMCERPKANMFRSSWLEPLRCPPCHVRQTKTSLHLFLLLLCERSRLRFSRLQAYTRCDTLRSAARTRLCGNFEALCLDELLTWVNGASGRLSKSRLFGSSRLRYCLLSSKVPFLW